MKETWGPKVFSCIETLVGRMEDVLSITNKLTYFMPLVSFYALGHVGVRIRWVRSVSFSEDFEYVTNE